MKKLGFGFMRLPIKNKDDVTSVDYDVLNQMVDSFMEKGFTYFDTAYVYHRGLSEVALRECLVKRYPRDSFVIADKLPVGFGVATKVEQEKVFNEQLERCGVDFFDYYLIHNIGSQRYGLIEKLESFKFVNEKRLEGKVKSFGFSFHDNAELLDKVLTDHPEVDFVQLQINYLDWDNESIQSRLCYEVAVKHNKKVIVMEPLKGGALVNIPDEAIELFKGYQPDLSVASWGIRYAASLENVMVVLSGMSNFEQLDDNTSYMKDFKPLNNDEKAIVNKAIEIVNNSIAVPCTACRYCVDDCPQKIAIPEYFALYNSRKKLKGNESFVEGMYYSGYANEGHGKASDCIECRMCEHHCPQHIDIVDFLKDVAKEFE